ncbi:MAG: hypothetical protein J2P30_00515, partial [Actinobacteria bacterium]|nr:hypothetical protein [Actinomycetota bacterium]
GGAAPGHRQDLRDQVGGRMSKLGPIDGEYFEFDRSKAPLHEAMLVEKELRTRYAQYEEDLRGGSAQALAMLARLVLLRNGRDVPLEDFESGKVAVDLFDLKWDDGEQDDAGPEADPKESPGPDGTPTTGTASSEFSPSISTSPPGI